VARWRARLATAAGMKIGIVWAGNPVHLNDVSRSIALDRLGSLFELSGTRWYSLQVGERAADLAKLPAGRITDLAAGLTDFAETAAAISALDLVISVDTAVAHLAGALGRPVCGFCCRSIPTGDGCSSAATPRGIRPPGWCASPRPAIGTM
jgi:hypothetical protein